VKQLLSQLGQIFAGGTPAQRLLAVLGGLVVLLGIGASIYLSTRPDYGLLFGNLDPSDASAVVEEVRAAGVVAEVRGGGRDVFVPRKSVSEMRMLVSAGGLPRGSGGAGWELFDKSSFGVSDFVQNVTYRRALQGALARDIQSFEAVESASVNITRPKRSAFLRDDRRAKASVIVRTRSGRKLSDENVQAIAHLIAGAVEGLDSGDVKVMDSKMRLLSEGAGDSLAAHAGKQLEFRLREEEVRQRRAQGMLDRMQIKADVRVAAAVEFQEIKETSETIDPEGTVALSETIENRSSRPASGGGGPAGTESKIKEGLSLPSSELQMEESDEKITTSYAASRKVRSQNINSPKVSRLSVSLVLHQQHADRLAEVEGLVKAAVGFDESRSDTLRSMVHEFETAADLPPLEEEVGSALLSMLLERGVQVVGILGALFLLLKILRSAERKSSARAAPAALGPHELHGLRAEFAAQQKEEAAAQAPERPAAPATISELVKQTVSADPGAANRVLRTWINGGEFN